MIGRMYPAWTQRIVSDTNSYSEPFVALLLSSSYTFDPSDIYISDLGAVEIDSGTGYIRVDLSGMTISRAGSVTTVTCEPITFPFITAAGSAAPRSMVIAKKGSSDTNSPLVLQQDFEMNVEASSEDISITAGAGGFIKYTSSP